MAVAIRVISFWETLLFQAVHFQHMATSPKWAYLETVALDGVTKDLIFTRQAQTLFMEKPQILSNPCLLDTCV